MKFEEDGSGTGGYAKEMSKEWWVKDDEDADDYICDYMSWWFVTVCNVHYNCDDDDDVVL